MKPFEPLDDAYVTRHSRPGEDWDDAHHRLVGEITDRYTKIPDCPLCSEEARSVAEARDTHLEGSCRTRIEEWPAAALDARVFKVVIAHHEQQRLAQAVIARQKMERYLDSMNLQEHPVNALVVSWEAQGYLNSCEQLDLLDRSELQAMQQAIYDVQKVQRPAFMQQYRDNDLKGMPWR